MYVVSFDGMKVQETYEFDEKVQEFVGLHAQTQVQSFRGHMVYYWVFGMNTNLQVFIFNRLQLGMM